MAVKVSRRRLVVGGMILIGVIWLVVITVFISNEPDPGVDSPAELQAGLTSALNGSDAEGLAGLIDYPSSDGEDFARAYLDSLAARGAHSIRVTLGPDPASPTMARIEGLRGDGSAFGYPVSVRDSEGSWAITFTPPLG